MKKLILNPNVSVGPFVFGTKREDMWAIMKKEFGSERDLPVFETEDYENPHVQLEYIDEKLISVTFIDDIRKRYCEIYLGNEKIWPRTEKNSYLYLGGIRSLKHLEHSIILNYRYLLIVTIIHLVLQSVVMATVMKS